MVATEASESGLLKSEASISFASFNSSLKLRLMLYWLASELLGCY